MRTVSVILSQAPAVNCTLTKLDLIFNNIADSGAAKLSSVCKVNTTA